MSTSTWHKQQEEVLKKWGEIAACYRYLHNHSYHKFKRMSLRFSLPIIIISTITGTASFAHETVPEQWRSIAPLIIGAFNLFGGILSTIQQFLKVNELLESHRVSSIHYGKLSRLIRLELALPLSERSYSGKDMLEICKLEYDRLIEQSPAIQGDVLRQFEKKFPEKNKELEQHLEFTRPEILCIHPVERFYDKKKPETTPNIKDLVEANKPYPDGENDSFYDNIRSPLKTSEESEPLEEPEPEGYESDRSFHETRLDIQMT